MADQCIQHLLEEHRVTEQNLTRLEGLLEALQLAGAWGAAQEEGFAAVRGFIERDWSLHKCKEDCILFPALKDFLPGEDGPLDVLRSGFEESFAAAGRMLHAAGQLSRHNNDVQALREFQRAARAFVQALRDHIYKEDRVLFPMVSRYLPEEQDTALAARMRSRLQP